MARPREFDEGAALDAAARRFWAQGYEATSVRDLAEAMGIGGASLYAAFGGKRQLYDRALAHYVEQSFCDRVRRLEGRLPPREAIAAFYGELVERSLSDRERRGCMLVNAAVELAPRDAGFRRAIDEVLRQMEGFFRRCVEAGQADGSITRRLPAAELAAHLLAVLLGLRVLARARPERALLEGLVRPALALLAPEN